MAIFIRLHNAYGDRLAREITAGLAGEELRWWPDPGNPEDIDIAVIWRMPHGFLKPFRNLKLIVGTGAGIDHFLLDPDLPRHVPMVRVMGEDFGRRMADYIACWTLFHHRDIAHFLAAQRAHEWAYRTMRSTHEVSVGVMGLGQMGATACRHLVNLGYAVRGWSRTPKAIDGVTCFAGPDGFRDFLAGTEILVNLLPLTPETANILSAPTFAHLPDGAVLISAGRGGHLVEADVLAALASGRLRAATIDAFPREPLPDDHPFWDHPGVYVTPHASGTASLETIVHSVVENVRRLRAGEPLFNLVDIEKGY
ncbi:MAG: 2-hydroxyacid dehydrogenase [Alphaproteobacteria bacterium]